MQYSKGFILLAIAAGLLDGVVAQGQFGQGGFGGQGQFGGGAGAGKGGQGQGKGGANQGKGGNGAGAAAASGANGAAAAQSTGTAAGGNAGGNGGGNANGGGLALDPNNVQTGSQSDGQAQGAEAGQAPSLTDNANFINFCGGQTLTNGLQVKAGSCNGIGRLSSSFTITRPS